MNWEPYRDLHKGKAAVILGSGPTIVDFREPENCIVFGCNSTIFSGIEIDYHVMQDAGALSNPHSFMSRMQDYLDYKPRHGKLWGSTLCPILAKKAEAAGAETYEFSHGELVQEGMALVENPQQQCDFSSDLVEKPPAAAGSIAVTAFQIALWMGCRRIYLAGIDVTDNRRWNDAKNKNDYRKQHHLQRWQEVVDWAQRTFSNIEIIVMNPVGLASAGLASVHTVRRMRIHMLCPAHTVPGMGMLQDAFTIKVERMSRVLAAAGHEVFVYAHEKSTNIGGELVACMDDEVLARSFGRGYVAGDWRKKIYQTPVNSEAVIVYQDRAKKELDARCGPTDIVCCWHGLGHRVATEGCKGIVCEPSVGYLSTFANFCAYETPFMRAYADGRANRKPRWYDCVIPTILDLSEFEFREQKSDYVLFLGRIDKFKGCEIAIEATKRAGMKLLIAGQGKLEDVGIKELPPHCSVLGFADVPMKRELLAGARAVIIPSNFAEPNCWVAAEAAASGTPVIASNHSGLPDNVVHGETGWLCQTMYDFVWALQNTDQISPAKCRSWSERYSLENALIRYEDWFRRLIGLKTGMDWSGIDSAQYRIVR